jgi:hypothetical protein
VRRRKLSIGNVEIGSRSFLGSGAAALAVARYNNPGYKGDAVVSDWILRLHSPIGLFTSLILQSTSTKYIYRVHLTEYI